MDTRKGFGRRVALAIAAAASFAGSGSAAAASADYPVRPVRFIVGFAPGGIADVMARALAQRLTDAFNQQVIVDNRPGGGGVISMQITAQAARDGYTMLMGSSTQFSITPALRANLTYDVLRDFMPVSRVGLTPVMLTVQASSSARSVQDLIDLAKSKAASPLSYGSTGYGGAPHIAAELLKKTAGIPMTHVPFKGGSEAVSALLGGHLHASFGAVSTSLAHVKAGRLRALGVTTAKRLSAVPDVPTFIESGLPGFTVEQWYGVFMPAGAPGPIVDKVSQEIGRILELPAAKAQFAGIGFELVASTPDDLRAYVKGELARWTKVLKELGINEAP